MLLCAAICPAPDVETAPLAVVTNIDCPVKTEEIDTGPFSVIMLMRPSDVLNGLPEKLILALDGVGVPVNNEPIPSVAFRSLT